MPLGTKAVITRTGIKYVARTDYVLETDAPDGFEEAPKPRAKNDPKHVAAACELRDRYLEQVNSQRLLPAAHGKYDVSRGPQSRYVGMGDPRALPDNTTTVVNGPPTPDVALGTAPNAPALRALLAA